MIPLNTLALSMTKDNKSSAKLDSPLVDPRATNHPNIAAKAVN